MVGLVQTGLVQTGRIAYESEVMSMAARKPPLHAVQPDEVPPAKRPQSVGAAAAGGDRLELLLALRARIAKTVEDSGTPPRDLAALSRRLLEIARDIEVIEAADGEGDDVGQAAATPDEKWSAN